MGRRKKYFDVKTEFVKHVTKNPATKCWNWNLALFRFRVNFGYGSIVLNPRRYCAYIHNYNIPVSRHIEQGCSNEFCVNPEHTRLKNTKRFLVPNTPLYLSFDDLEMGSSAARLYYGRTMQEMRDARAATIEVIRRIKKEPVRATLEQIAETYEVGVTFAKRARELTLAEFNRIKEDQYDTGEEPLDERGEEMLPDAQFF